MSDEKTRYRFLFSGGGTGGHLFPAVAVAEQIKLMKPEAEILFVGTKNKIEGKVIPKLGYRFKSIWIKGFSRRITIDNLLFPIRLFVSMIQSLAINMAFKPRVAVGSGGYVAGPAIWGSSVMGAKIILLEQNSYPGVTTRLLERYADEIHISFNDSKKYLRKQNKLFTTGNPVRKDFGSVEKKEAIKRFGFSEDKKILLILGGSLGAESINKATAVCVEKLSNNGIQVIWQTGKNYFDEYNHLISRKIKVCDFIDDMNSAYSACDLLLARAGATTIAEILVLGIPSILVPSPNVAKNHQYHNAKSLADEGAAKLIEDKELISNLSEIVLALITSEKKLKKLKMSALALAKPDAAKVIAESALKYAEAI
jgi:UDP-N-acetylglucosamine--N-acetylmuramyl-(pentapeptide) pyrophosphoryl-undecaprenol N-acetylglucosamine transferase